MQALLIVQARGNAAGSFCAPAHIHTAWLELPSGGELVHAMMGVGSEPMSFCRGRYLVWGTGRWHTSVACAGAYMMHRAALHPPALSVSSPTSSHAGLGRRDDVPQPASKARPLL